MEAEFWNIFWPAFAGTLVACACAAILVAAYTLIKWWRELRELISDRRF